MDQDGSDLPNNEPVAVTSTVDAQPTQTTAQRTPALFPGELTMLVLSRQTGGTTGLTEDPRSLVPLVDGEGTVTTAKPGSDGVPTLIVPGATGATGRTPARTPFMLHPRPQPSRAARLFLVLFKCCYKCVKIVWWAVFLTVIFALPGLASSYAGNAICQSLGFPHYRTPVADVLIVVILGSTISFFILMIPTFVLFVYFPFDDIFGPPPQRLFRPSTGSTATTIEDPPFLFLFFPVVYLYALLSIVTVTKVTKPENSAGEKLTRKQVARVAALGSLPVSMFYVLIMPFIVAFAQRADRAVNNWKRGIAKLEPRVYDDSILRTVVYQYTFFFRRGKARTAQPPLGDGTA